MEITFKKRKAELEKKAAELGMNLDYERQLKGIFPVQDESWLKSRKEGIGGSDAGTIIGLNHYSTPLNLYIDKTTPVSSIKKVDAETQYTLDFGHVMEKLMLDLYAAKTGFKVWQGNQEQWFHPFYPYMQGDCDGYALTQEGEKIGIECKTFNYEMKNAWRSGVYGKGGVVKNPEYVAQVAHYMAVENLTRFDLIAICGNNPKDLVVVTFYRDLEFEKYLIEEEGKFWQHVQNRIPPEISSMPEPAYKKIVGELRDGELVKSVAILDAKHFDALKEIEELDQKKTELNSKIKDIDDKIQALRISVIEDMGKYEKAELSLDGVKYTVSLKPTIRKGVDIDGLEIAYPEIYEAFKKENVSSPVWRMKKTVTGK